MDNVIKIEFGKERSHLKKRFDPHELGKIMLFYQENPPKSSAKLKIVPNISNSDEA